MTRKLVFDNGTYCDGRKRLVTIVTRDGEVYNQNPYRRGKMKNCKTFK